MHASGGASKFGFRARLSSSVNNRSGARPGRRCVDLVNLTEVANVASGLFMMALGAFVLSVRPRRPGNVAFVLFSMGFGVSIATSNWTALIVGAPLLNLAIGTVAHVTAIVGLVGMMLAFPSPLARNQQWVVWWGLGAAAMATAATTVWGMPPFIFDGMLAFLGLPASAVGFLVAYSAISLWVTYTVVAYLFVIAFRVLKSPPNATAQRRQYELVTVALLLYAAYVAGGGVSAVHPVFPMTPLTAITTGLLTGAMLGLAGLWMRETANGPDSRTARNLALLALALPTIGLILSATRGAYEVRGVLRTTSVAILAYAMLRHQLLGLDVRVRWGISRGSVAGIFIAVFFITSEAAQQFFGDTLDSAYLGIAAAGLLVFVIAPLQGLAERFAMKAVPMAPVETPTTPAQAAKEDAYKHALTIALRDRALTRDEEIHLYELAEQLGIGASRAMALRVDVELELERAPAN